MTTDTPWTSAETLSRLSRQKFGKDLSSLVAEKLLNDGGERGLWNSHRDSCGHGLIYQDAQFQLVAVHDGHASEGKVLKTWDSSDAFVAWLEEQSDFSLSGADESEPALRPRTPSNLNNQRITLARLRDYVHDCTASLAPFRDFVFAADLEFGFLVREYGFRKIRPRMDGRECVVAYRKNPNAGITIVTEFHSTPFIMVTLTANSKEESFSNKPLVSLARKKDPNWKAPEFSSGDKNESAYRRYLSAFAELLRQQFPEILSPHVNEPVAQDARQPAGAGTNPPYQAMDRSSLNKRIWGAAITVIAFLLLVLELRYFKVESTPAATGSLRGNLGILLLLSLPWLALAIGFLQAVSGASIRNLGTTFAALPLRRRIGLGIATVGTVIGATFAAAYVS